MSCNQKGCQNPGAYRFTWPGENEKTICEAHVGTLRGVSAAMGLHLQVIPLPQGDGDPSPVTEAQTE